MTGSVPPTDIYAILSGWAAAQQRDDDAARAELSSDLKQYLEQQSESLAQVFQDNNTVQVKLADHGLNINQVLQHDAVLAWQSLRQTPEHYTSLPEGCPRCNTFLSDWHCQHCGLELFRWQQRGVLYTDGMGALPFGMALLADPRRRRLLFLKLSEQAAPQVVWQINFPMEFPPHGAQLLSANEVLVFSHSGKVQIVDLFGEVSWNCKLSLHKPVFAQGIFKNGRAERILIVDEKAHQVLVTDRQQQMHWQYGKALKPGQEVGQLRAPQAAGLTHEGHYLICDTGNQRVIEVNAISRTLRKTHLSNAGLKTPMWCEGLPHQRFNVIDAASYRFYDSDMQDQSLNSCSYYQDAMDLRYRVKDAAGALRRENGHVLIYNRDRLIEISPSQKRLLWYIPLTDLRQSAKQAKTKPYTPPKNVTLRKTLSTRLKTPFQLDKVLREVSVFQGAPDSFFEKIKLCLRYEEYPAGQILLREGQRGDAMFLLREGEVEVIKEFQQVATLGPGDVFGEMALLNSTPRTATIKTRTLCRMYRLNKLIFETVIQSFPEVYQRIRALSEARSLADEQRLQNKADKKLTPGANARARLQQLMEKHTSRVRPATRTHSVLSAGPTHWKLRYNDIEQHVIQESTRTGHQCFEIHVQLVPGCQMKSARVSLLVMQLEKAGEIVKTYPGPEAILKEKMDDTVVITLVTRQTRAQVLDIAASVSEIESVHAIPVKF